MAKVRSHAASSIVSTVPPVEAPAAVFETQEDALQAFKDGQLNRDVIVVLRFQGPRANGMPVRWRTVPGGFRFDGLPPQKWPDQWLSPATLVLGPSTLVLGPEPLIPAQRIMLALGERRLTLATEMQAALSYKILNQLRASATGSPQR